MSWICNKCETANPDFAIECEVCSSVVPIIKDISHSEIDINKPTSISWNAINCDEIILTYKSKEYNVTSKKEFELSIIENSTITFKVLNATTTRYYSFPIYIRPPRIVKFNTNKSLILEGSIINLEWEVVNSNLVRIEGLGIQKEQGNIAIPAIANYYKLIAENYSESISRTIEIQILKKPIINFKLTRNKLRKNTIENSILTWNIKNAISSKLLINGVEREIKFSGTEIVKPEKTTTYEIQAIGLDKKTIFTKKITLYVLPDCEIEFAANKQYTYPRIPVLLNWNVKHAKFVELIGYGNVEHEGSKIVEIEKDEIFELKVIGAFGVKTKQVHVKVLPLPLIKSLLIPTPKINHKTKINIYQTNLQPFVGIPSNLHTSISIPPLVEPNYNTIKVEMNKPPIFHSFNFDLKGITWWNKIWDKIKSIKGYKF